jgi:hypothetical protein
VSAAIVELTPIVGVKAACEALNVPVPTSSGAGTSRNCWGWRNDG